ncbi:hypothetical protein KY284_008026 [Solanum tuberosum]|nr:hypothetical protein KY284_008026 [Solanum tuberosum]
MSRLGCTLASCNRHRESEEPLGASSLVVATSTTVVAIKGFHSSLNNVMPSLGVVPPRKSPSTSSDDKKFAQPNDINATEVVVNLLTHRKSFKPSSWTLLPEYDALRSSKVTKESYEKVLSNAQRCLDGAKLAHEKLDGSMGKLQVTFIDVEKDIEALTSKKKKVITLLNKYQEKLSKSQENVTITEGEIYTIEANHTLMMKWRD